ncbi:hypothetical protein [Neobacillus sp. D3-1R]|uniref:hypothetical protein n=1 Tax=Neobacillus sp. D3-1R TaxID=3445778 RepID=UPI003FA019AD
MSLKAIELQVALPRTQDAGKLQEQIQQRGQILQDQIAEQSQKEQEKKRSTVIKNETTEKAILRNKRESNQENQQQKSNQQKRDQIKDSKHPYKGTKIDFSG